MSRFVLTAQLQLQAPNNVAQVVRQIQSQLNNVQVNVQVQGTQTAQRQINQLTRQTNDATTAAQRMGRAFAISVRRFAAFSIATRAVSLFTSTLSDAVKTAIDFEREMVRVSQVTGDSLAKLKSFSKVVTDLSTSFGVASSDILQSGQLLLQAGISAKDTEVALKSLAKAALAPNFDSLSETTEGAIAILAQFGEGVGALEKQLGSINAVAGAFAVEAGDLIDVIRRAGGVFKSSGGDLNELIALFTSVRATTRESAESIGTGLRTIFTRIQRPKTIEFLKQFGVELVDLEGKFVGPFEAVRRLSEALSGLGEGDITFIRIAEELGGFRQIGKVLPLLQQFSVAQSALNVANKAGNSLTQDAATAQQALAVRITKVREEFLALIRSVTETATFQIMANTALTLASALIKVADAIKPLLPLLTALTAIRIAKGLGSFVGSFAGGLSSSRTFNKGGKVHHFARGGMVPGTGNRDTVPAMLQPGEFVIRKSSVNKLGASNLAAMNENRYATGGIIALNPYDKGTPDTAIRRSGEITVADVAARAGIPTDKGYRERFSEAASMSANKELAILAKTGKLNVNAVGLSIGDETVSSETERQIKDSFAKLINTSSGALASRFGTSPSKQITPQDLELFGINGVIGNAFEAMLTSLGAPFDNPPQDEIQKAVNKANNNSAFDYPSGIGSLGKGNLSLLSNIPTDAKRTVTGKEVNEIITKKYPNLLADAAKQSMVAIKGKELSSLKPKDTGYRVSDLKAYGVKTAKDLENLGWTSPFRGKWNPPIAKHFGGLIQKFAKGGMAQPLVDDILSNASNAILPKPQSAIQKLIKSGGGFVDIDRTLKRTIGDQAYARARTEKERQAVLSKYFTNSTARLNDIKTAGLTQFGVELQNSIKSGQLSGSSIRVISKSPNTPGVADYLSSIFGIPSRNFAFTSGRSKVPLMRKFATGGGVGTDTVPALLTPGEFVVNRKAAQNIGYGALNRMNKVGKYANGGIVQQFAAGTSGSGIQPPRYSGSGPVMSGVGGNLIPFDTLSRQARNLANAQQVLTKTTQTLNGATQQASQATQQSAQSVQQVAQAQSQQKRSAGEVIAQNKMFAASMATSLIQGFLPAVDDNSSALLRVTHSLLGLVATITTVGFALEAFGVSLSAKQIMQLFGSGPASIGGLFKTAIQGITKSGNLRDIVKAGPLAQGAYRTGGAIGNITSRAGNAIGSSSLGRGFSAGLSGKSVIGGGSRSVLGNIGGFLGQGARRVGDKFERFSTGARLGTSSRFSLQDIIFGQGGRAGVSGKLGGIVGKGAGTAGRLLGKIPGAGTVGRLAGGIATRVGAAGGLGAVGAAAAGPALAVTGIIAAINSAIGAFKNLDGQLKKSIEAGKVEEASKLAVAKAAADFPLIGNIVTGIADIFGGSDAVNAALIGINTLFGGPSLDSVKALAASQAGAVKTQKALEDAQRTATNAMQDFENGTITASDALVKIRAATEEVKAQEKRAGDFAIKNLENRASGGFTGRNIASFLSLGLVESSSTRNERLGQQSAEQIKQASKFQAEAFQLESAARQATIKSGFARGIDPEELRKQAVGDLSGRRTELLKQANVAAAAGDKVSEQAFRDSAEQLRQQIEQVDREMANLEKEVARAKAAFDAMNLGLRGPTATATAMSASMERFASSFEVGGSSFVSSSQFLSEAVSSAAQAMNPADIKSAVSDVSNGLRELGLPQDLITKFENNVSGFVQAQQNYNKAFNKIRADIDANRKAGRKAGDTPEEVKKAFAEELTAGLGGEAKKNLEAIINNIQLSPDEVDKILSGDLSIFGDKLTEAGRKQIEEIQKISAERQKAEQVIIELTRKRIDAERKLVEAQQEALDLFLEGREVQAGAGGRAVTEGERRGVILGRSNAQGDRLGLTSLRTGSAAELRRRNVEMVARAAGFEGASRTQGGLQRVAGVEASEAQKDLQQAYKQQVDTIRSLIKLEQEELKIIQEKNKLEKESLESLISGDIDKFFEQQAAVGATAAIATGDERLIQSFGAKALGDAFKNLQAQQQAGVQSAFGMQLGGAGGLLEMGANAALASRGVTDPFAARTLAGTTPEEEARKARIRELGGILGETGQVGVDMARMELNSAEIIISQANVKLQEITQRGVAAAEQAAGRSRGGMVYASNGMFVPRGTDTVPAMLTPGEFVVNRGAVNRGNNLQILQAMNNGTNAAGMNMGGKVSYYNKGGKVNYLAEGGQPVSGSGPMIDPKIVSDLSNALNNFNTQLRDNITSLRNTKFQIKLDTTNVNVNLSGGSFLQGLTQKLKEDLVREVGKEISSYKVGPGGSLQKNNSVLA